MSAQKPYYFWDPIGMDPEHPGKPKWVQLRTQSQEWERRLWGFMPKGLGDSCWRLGLYVACHPEDELAIMSLFYLLDNKLRYFGDQPERGVPWTQRLRRYRHPRRYFTRDQLIAGVFGLVMAGRMDLVKELKFPWFISPTQRTTIGLRSWLRFLKTGEAKHARKFHLYTIVTYWFYNKTNTLPMYARHLKSLMLFLCPDPDCSMAVMEKVSPQNILLHLLNDYNEQLCLMIKPDEYVAREGWQWQGTEFGHKSPLDEDDPIKLDKELLIKISELWVQKKLKENPMSLMKAMFGNGSPGSIRN